ncbi:MAG: MraY family glycosyltransferase [Phycisphaerae bacterium]|nr:MraY family glycosyltransferase [Phycisphaerae bacterium]
MLANVTGSYKSVNWMLQFWPVLLVAFLAALPGTWLCRRIALKFGIVDNPDGVVKTHTKPIAYLGGIGIFTGFAASIVVGIVLLGDSEQSGKYLQWLTGILGGGAIACFVGLVDDLLDISPKQKILGQVIAGILLIGVGIMPSLERFWIPFAIYLPQWINYVIGVSLVIIFVLGATNSLNLLDGLDGLCAGVTVIITAAMLLLSIHLVSRNANNAGDMICFIISLGLLGAVLGFLPFNRHPAKIFMGDAGSMLLGFSVAVLMILFARRSPRWWMASILIFGLPILDTAVALARRALNNRPLFVSDRGHIYDQMIDRGLSLKKTVRICYFLSGLYALLGIIISQVRTRYAAVIFLLVIIVSAVAVWKKGFLKMEGLRGVAKKK